MDDYTVTEKQSSIEVSRNAKGDFTFKVKTYYDEQLTDWQRIVDHTEEIMNDLKERFK